MKQKMPKKAGTIKPNQDDEKSSPTKSSEGQGDNGDQKSKKDQKESDLVERIALDLGNLLKLFLFSNDHRGARKMNLFYHRGGVNHNIKVPPM